MRYVERFGILEKIIKNFVNLLTFVSECVKYLRSTRQKVMKVCIYKVMPEDAKPAIGGFRIGGG
jgi:hypothetical protein